MRSSAITLAPVVCLALAAACAAPNAGKVCDPVASWSAPAYRCVAPVAEPEPEPVAAPPPKAEVKGDKIELKETVEFKTGSHELANVSDAVLDEVVQIMKAHPEIARIRIEGHTDSMGGNAYNQKLSALRAKTVKEYLGSHGIETSRLISKGFGETRPIADNGTDEGRAKNRRVEIHIEQRK